MASNLFIIEDCDAYEACWDRLAQAGVAEGSTGDVIRLVMPARGAAASGKGGGLRFVRTGHPCLWLTLEVASEGLRAIVEAALSGVGYRLLADGDPSRPTSLEAAFARVGSAGADPVAVPACTHCAICARPLEHWLNGSTQGAYCPACRCWGWVTTYWPPILADGTVYHVLAAPIARPSAAQVRAVARVTGVGLLAAKQVIAAFPAAVFAGRAEAVLPVLVALDGAGVACTVEPAFRWTPADAPEVVRAAGPRPASSNDPPAVTALP